MKERKILVRTAIHFPSAGLLYWPCWNCLFQFLTEVTTLLEFHIKVTAVTYCVLNSYQHHNIHCTMIHTVIPHSISLSRLSLGVSSAWWLVFPDPEGCSLMEHQINFSTFFLAMHYLFSMFIVIFSF